MRTERERAERKCGGAAARRSETHADAREPAERARGGGTGGERAHPAHPRDQPPAIGADLRVL